MVLDIRCRYPETSEEKTSSLITSRNVCRLVTMSRSPSKLDVRLSTTLIGCLGPNGPALMSDETLKREGSPRTGGPKEARVNRVRLMDTGRYFEACTARGESFEDIDSMHSLRIDNLYWTSEETLKNEFKVFGKIGDVYRPVNKDTKKPLSFVFVRFLNRTDMLNAMESLQGKIVDGRPMRIEEAKSSFELETSIY